MKAFFCPCCKRFYADADTVVVVMPPRRKNKRGRIAWNRDGICAECARKKQKEDGDA